MQTAASLAEQGHQAMSATDMIWSIWVPFISWFEIDFSDTRSMRGISLQWHLCHHGHDVCSVHLVSASVDIFFRTNCASAYICLQKNWLHARSRQWLWRREFISWACLWRCVLKRVWGLSCSITTFACSSFIIPSRFEYISINLCDEFANWAFKGIVLEGWRLKIFAH